MANQLSRGNDAGQGASLNARPAADEGDRSRTDPKLSLAGGRYRAPISNTIVFSSITLACPDPATLAAFYAEVTGDEVTFVHKKESASVRCEGAA